MKEFKLKKILLSTLFMAMFSVLSYNVVNAATLSISPNKASGTSTKTGKTSSFVLGESISYSIKHYHGGDHEKHALSDGYLRGGVYRVTLCVQDGNTQLLETVLDDSHDDPNNTSEIIFNQTITKTKTIPSSMRGKTGWIEIWLRCGDYNTTQENYIQVTSLTYVTHEHDYNQSVVDSKFKKSDATCASPAIYYKSCKCGAKGTATFSSGSKNTSNHAGGTTVTPATCGAGGKTVCKGCGATIATTSATGNHSWGSWSTTTPASCTAKGSQKRTCSVCGATQTQDIPIKGHAYADNSWGKPTITWASSGYTATWSQSVTQKCSSCSATRAGTTLTGNCSISNSITTWPEYGKAGTRTYTASVTSHGQSNSSTKGETLTALSYTASIGSGLNAEYGKTKTATFSVAPKIDGVAQASTYQWQVKKSGNWSNLSNANGWSGVTTLTVGYNPSVYDTSIQAIRCVATTTLKDPKHTDKSATKSVTSSEEAVWGSSTLPSFAPQITTNLTTLSGTEGMTAEFGTIFTKKNSGDQIIWQYTTDGNTYRNIDANTKLYCVREAVENVDPDTGNVSYSYSGDWYMLATDVAEPLIANGRYSEEKDNLQVISFAFSESNNQRLIIKNLRIPLTGTAFRAVARAGISGINDTYAGPLAISVYKSNYSSFDVTCLNQYMNIKSEIDPANITQFAIILHYDNGTIQYLRNDRRVRFFKANSGDDLQQIKDNFCTEVSGVTGETTVNGVTMGTYVEGGTTYTAYKNGDKWYICKYGLNELCALGDGGGLITNQPGTRTRGDSNLEGTNGFSDLVKQGTNDYYIIIPDFENPTRTLIALVKVTGVDLEAPQLTEIKANWVSSLGTLEDHSDAAIEEEYVPGSGVVKGSNFSMRLLVDEEGIKDNVATFGMAGAEHNITLQWKKDGNDLAGATGNVLWIGGGGDPCGYYELYAFDDAEPANFSSVGINLATAWDTQGPEFTYIVNPPMEEASSYRTVTIDVKDTPDNPANLADKAYAFVGPIDPRDTNFDPTFWISELGQGDSHWSIANSYTVTENGDYYIYVRDKAGNITYLSGTDDAIVPISVSNIDHDAPAINGVDVQPSTKEDGTPNPEAGEKQYIKIIVNADDNGNEGPLLYKLEKEGVTLIDWTPNNVFDEIKEGGSYVVYVKDSAGNISRYVINNIDKRVVLGLLEGDAVLQERFGVYVKCSNRKYWTNEDIEITLEGGNPNILAADCPFSFNNGPWTNDRKFIVRENGTFTLNIKDIYGHTYPYTNITIECIDKVAPTFTATPSGKNSTITINASDDPDQENGSGLNELFYFFDGVKRTVMAFNENTHVSGPQTIMVENFGTYEIWVTDKAGNSYTKSIEITSAMTDNPLFVDDNGEPLSEEEVAAKITSLISANPSGWTRENVTLTFTPISTEGFARNPYSWDGGTNWLSSQNYTVSQNGDYTLLIKDMYGNIYHSNPIAVNNIDKIAPTLEVEQQANNLIISSSDAQSGVARLAWVGGTVTTATTLKSYNGNQSSVNCVAELPSNGSYTIYAYDEAGNMNTVTKTITGVVIRNNDPTPTPTPKTDPDPTPIPQQVTPTPAPQQQVTPAPTQTNTGTNTVEKYYYNTEVEKETPVYVEKYVNSGTSNNNNGNNSGYRYPTYTQPTYTQPTYTQPTYTQPASTYTQPTSLTTTANRITTPTPTPTPTPSPTPATTANKAGGTASKTSTKSSTVTQASAKPSSTATKVTQKVESTPVKISEEEDVEVLDKENAAKYRNSRVAGSVNATNDSKNGKGINIVLGIVGSLIALSGIAAGVYWYTTKYKPALIDGELSKDDYAFAEDIAMAQSEDGEDT